jgi:ATP-dependent protease ClpP protease subunit
MAKELYIYSPIYSYVAEAANKELSRLEEGEDITVRINSPGGEVNAGFSFLSKLSELKGKKTAIVDGRAMSMAANWLVFFDDVIANDTSDLMFHKAAFPEWYKATKQELENLDKWNNRVESKLSKKVSDKDGGSDFISKVFQKDTRNDVYLTASQAKKLGIVTKVRKIEPTAYHNVDIVAMRDTNISADTKETKNKKTNMNTPEELRAQNPALYASVFGLGEESGEEKGRKKEKIRCAAWGVYAKLDPERVQKALSGDDEVDASVMAEMSLKMVSNQQIDNHKEDNAPPVKPTETVKTEEEIKAEEKKATFEEFLKG